MGQVMRAAAVSRLYGAHARSASGGVLAPKTHMPCRRNQRAWVLWAMVTASAGPATSSRPSVTHSPR